MIDVVGLGEAGWEVLDGRARGLVTGARVLLGGRRHLGLVPAVAGQERHTWPSPLRAGLSGLLAEIEVDRGGVVALASGDPLRSGVGTTLVDLLGAAAVRIHPALSSETLARARMGWSAETTDVVTAVGRDLRAVLPLLAPGARVVVLCSDGADPARLAALLTDRGFGMATLTTLWRLGGVDEGSRTGSAASWPAGELTPDLVLCCVEVPLGAAAAGPAPGRPEDAFDHDGQITKRDVRASALAHLRPTAGAHLWDLGAGSGSVGLEWCLAAPRATCTAVERDPARVDRIRCNADDLGVGARLSVVAAGLSEAPFADLPSPDAVFVGGGLSAAVLDAVRPHVPVGGRLVAHAVTLETEAVLVAARADLVRAGWDAELTRLTVEHARPLGRYLSWTPARPVVQLSALRKDQP
ncbi:precorrin-6y C5,15-methyltransferase (decarboxylating) subunit CbiE [Ornithinimicrobium tianjinense]|uniref:Precorrin-6Y C5,15-methyltransferase (Decarboxylating) n=1 Tax=Ornithinimicrobium tianjinense TaxID=1195761 RepID=A0A917BMQ1_9MICO|nr:precorrin-6y C5,15-methyltransferase (decarboxylating) subunit CbiE [Ornithinimicrobium tianjinense]GGF51898.1 precorrin-6Y C5,15-methyltransferase (decarboxylating) [Ornithinimicrobium tianjinense]